MQITGVDESVKIEDDHGKGNSVNTTHKERNRVSSRQISVGFAKKVFESLVRLDHRLDLTNVIY